MFEKNNRSISPFCSTSHLQPSRGERILGEAGRETAGALKDSGGKREPERLWGVIS